MFDFRILRATQVVEKTMAYTIYRLALYLGLSFGFVVATIAGVGMGLMVGAFFRESVFFISVTAIAGFAAFGAVLYFSRGSWLYRVKAPHLVIINESMDERVVQHGWSQVVYARQLVNSRFEGASDLRCLYEAIQGFLLDLVETRTERGSKLLQGLARLPGFVRERLVLFPLCGIAEVILSCCFRHRDQSVSVAVGDAMAVCARNFRVLLRNVLALFALNILASLAVYMLVLAPVGWLEELLPVAIGGWKYVLALLLVWPVKAAVFDPVVSAAMIDLFERVADSQPVDTPFRSGLAGDSEIFAQLLAEADAEHAETSGDSDAEAEEETGESASGDSGTQAS